MLHQVTAGALGGMLLQAESKHHLSAGTLVRGAQLCGYHPLLRLFEVQDACACVQTRFIPTFRAPGHACLQAVTSTEVAGYLQ